MKKPNGYGTIKKLTGNRRRPFAFVVTKNGKQKPVEYFENLADAEIFQASYSQQKIKTIETFKDIYLEWLPQHINHFNPSKSAISCYKNAFKHCEKIQHLPINEIKYTHYQSIIDEIRQIGLSYSSAKKVKSFISLVEKHAMKTDRISKQYAPLINIGKNAKIYPHTIFTRQQINKIWNSDIPGTATVLILLYTGMRVGEMLTLRKSDVNMKQKYINIRKSKTLSGIRIIPIHDRIYPLIKALIETNKTYLIEKDGRALSYSGYRPVWNNIMKKLKIKHRPHDCRHTVATLLDNSDANPNAKRRILGHSGGDITDRIYTHKTIRQLRKTIQLLK